MPKHLRFLLAACTALVTVLASPAFAAAPGTALVEGVLLSGSGAPAADGDYDATFAVYDVATGGVAAWTETGKIKVAGGRFAHALGASKPIEIAKLAALKEQWVGVKIGSDPELGRQPMHAVPFSLAAASAAALSCDGCIGADQLGNGAVAAAKVGFLYAGSSTKGGPALDVACTGCVTVAEMKFDGDVDLGGNSLKAKNGTFGGDVVAASVTATTFVGDGSKLTGIKTPAGSCTKAGEVVKGIASDGTLICVAALDPTALPKDGLNEISNDLISNQFNDTIAGAAGLKIPDNTGADANAVLDFPDIGIAQDFSLSVEIANTDLSKVAIGVLPPDDKKVGWKLCDPCGKTDEKAYKVTFTKDNMPKTGDLAAWIGANPKGQWNLKVLDTGFCLPQAPGNDKLCDAVAKTDGSIVKWSITVKTLSNKKVAFGGDVYVGGTLWGKDNGHGVPGGPLKLGGTVDGAVLNAPQLTTAKPTCNAANVGALRWDEAFGLQVCNTNPQKSGPMQYAWTIARSTPVAFQGGCKSHSQGSNWAKYCLDGTEYNNAGDYFSVNTSGDVTIKIGGQYRVEFYAIQHGCGQQDLQIVQNGVGKAYSHNIGPSTTNQWNQAAVNYTGPMVAGDVLFAQAYHDGCGNQYQWHSWNSSGSHSRFRLEYVGPIAGK